MNSGGSCWFCTEHIVYRYILTFKYSVDYIQFEFADGKMEFELSTLYWCNMHNPLHFSEKNLWHLRWMLKYFLYLTSILDIIVEVWDEIETNNIATISRECHPTHLRQPRVLGPLHSPRKLLASEDATSDNAR